MTVMQSGGGGRGPSPTGLADVIETILDKGMVIDAYVRVSLVGIEVLTIDARVVIASVDTYLRFAEAVNRLLVVGFYLLNLGFVTLTMRMSGNIESARQGMQLLSVKIGEVLLVLGVLHFANLALFARFRGRGRAEDLLARQTHGRARAEDLLARQVHGLE